MTLAVTSGQRAQVFVVGEDPLARSTLVAAIARADVVDVAGQASPQEETARAAETAGATVMLWDLGIDVRRGLDRLREQLPSEIPVLALVPDDAAAREAFLAGVHGLVTRGAELERIAHALAAAAQGFVVLDDAIAARITRRAPSSDRRLEESLTARELEVLELLAQGLSNKLIADRLDISEHTAKFHVTAIMTKLGADTRTEAVVLAAKLGLLVL